jgi:hypothetical protein
VSGQATGREYERIVKGEQPERRLGWRVDRGDWKVGGCMAAATDSSQLVMFVVKRQRYALPLEIVERVVRAVSVR